MTTELSRRLVPSILSLEDLASETGVYRLHAGGTTLDSYVRVTLPSPTRLTAGQALELNEFMREPIVARTLQQPHRVAPLDLKAWLDPGAGNTGAALILSPSVPGRLMLLELKLVRIILDTQGVLPTLERLARGDGPKHNTRPRLRELFG